MNPAVSTVAEALADIHQSTRALGRDLAQAHSLGHGVCLTCVRHRAGHLRIALSDINLAAALSVDLDLDLDVDLNRAHAVAGDLYIELARVSRHPVRSAHASTGAIDAARARKQAKRLNYALSAACKKAERGNGGVVRTPAMGAARLLAVAAWVLPAGDRARYGEEFRSELAEVALAGGGRFAQLAHSARVVVSSVRLRWELAPPQRHGATS